MAAISSFAGVKLNAAVASKVAAKKAVVVRASAESEETSRRSVLSLIASSVAVATFAKSATAVSQIGLEGPPPPSGGLPGTDSSDQARDTDAPLKERFYLQPKTPAEALVRAKESVAVLSEVKQYVDNQAWAYVRNELRSEFGYLRLDLSTVINSKPKQERKELNAEAKRVIEAIEALDFAARAKNPKKAQELFASTESQLTALLNKL